MVYNWVNLDVLVKENTIVPKDRRHLNPPIGEDIEYMKRVKKIVDDSPNNGFYSAIASLMYGVKCSLENGGPELFVSCADALGQRLGKDPEKLPKQEKRIYEKLENIISQLQLLSTYYLKNKKFGEIYPHVTNYYYNYFNSIGKVLVDTKPKNKQEEAKRLTTDCIHLLDRQERVYARLEKYEKAARARDGIKELKKHYLILSL